MSSKMGLRRNNDVMIYTISCVEEQHPRCSCSYAKHCPDAGLLAGEWAIQTGAYIQISNLLGRLANP